MCKDSRVHAGYQFRMFRVKRVPPRPWEAVSYTVSFCRPPPIEFSLSSMKSVSKEGLQLFRA